MNQTRTFFVLAAAAALALTACSSPGAEGGAAATDPPASDSQMIATEDLSVAGSWVLASNPDITLEITPTGEASGSGGCNTYTTTIGQDPATGNLVVGPVASTRMACEQEVMDAEHAYTNALEGVVSGEVADDSLTLVTLEGEELAFDAA